MQRLSSAEGVRKQRRVSGKELELAKGCMARARQGNPSLLNRITACCAMFVHSPQKILTSLLDGHLFFCSLSPCPSSPYLTCAAPIEKPPTTIRESATPFASSASITSRTLALIMSVPSTSSGPSGSSFFRSGRPDGSPSTVHRQRSSMLRIVLRTRGEAGGCGSAGEEKHDGGQEHTVTDRLEQ